MSTPQIAQFWRDSSQKDFAFAEQIFESGSGRYVYCLFFVHLAVEKQLKALIVHTQHVDPPFDHNLANLAAHVGNEHFTLEQRQLLADMTAFNIKGRYDDYKSTFAATATKDYTQSYLALAKEFLLWTHTHFQ
jgi:HEPN domain-containing protein